MFWDLKYRNKYSIILHSIWVKSSISTAVDMARLKSAMLLGAVMASFKLSKVLRENVAIQQGRDSRDIRENVTIQQGRDRRILPSSSLPTCGNTGSQVFCHKNRNNCDDRQVKWNCQRTCNVRKY